MASIERQYISPNCTLLLQGFSDDDNSNEVIPIMSVLTQAQCQIMGNHTVLKGGLTFIQNLLKVVSAYAQELLSGLPHKVEWDSDSDYICLNKLADKNRHHLLWQEKKDDSSNQLELELSTIEFFDLLDTIDQLCLDQYTLPQLEDKPQPLSRRYRQKENTLVEQSTPITIGLVSVALASIVFFLIPNPSTIKDPNQEPKPTPSNTELVPPNTIP